MAKGYYRCECGKEFTNPQSFNGHKSRCKIHHMAIGNYDEWASEESARAIKREEVKRNKSKINKEEKQKRWISEQHTCEHCGKVMTEKFGSGRFCSRSCANSHEVTGQQPDD